MLYREGTVNSQRACYFHEPFNVASKDIYIIYHSEMSQKTHLQRACLKTPVCFLFFSPPSPTLKRKIQINLFFFSEACLRRDSVTWTFSWGIHISSAHAACSICEKVGDFFLPTSLFLCLPFLLISLTFFVCFSNQQIQSIAADPKQLPPLCPSHWNWGEPLNRIKKRLDGAEARKCWERKG